MNKAEYHFDTVTDRGPASNTYSMKWQGYETVFSGFHIDTENTLSMWVADMDFETPAVVKDAIMKRAEHGIYGYVSKDGIDDYRDAAISWFRRRYAWENCEREWMLFFPGVVPAINTAIQAFTGPGDGVIVQMPVYYPFMKGAKENGRVVVNNALKETDLVYEMDFEQLESVAKNPANKLLILSDPHNPVGRVWKAEELKQVFDICAKNDVIVFCDEIHSDLIMPLPGNRHYTAGRFTQYYDRLILAHSASKSFNLAGLSSALITVPDSTLREKLSLQMSANHYPGGNTFGPIAGAAAWRGGDDYIDALCGYIHENVCYAKEHLQKSLPMIRMAPVEGTYLVWMDFRALGLPGEVLYRMVLEDAKVAGDLGRWFGEGGEPFMRFNFACPRAKITDFLKRMDTLLQRHDTT